MPLARWLKLCFKILPLCAIALLSGCLQYDLDLQFDSQTHGQWTQRVEWRGGLPTSSTTLETWLADIRDRTQGLGGSVEMLGDRAFQIRLPFNNAAEFVAQFNHFFDPPPPALPFTLPNGEPIRAVVTLHQQNWLVVLQNHLTLTVDLTAIPDLADSNFSLVRTTQLLEGHIHLTTPWGLTPSQTDNANPNDWLLQVGTVNYVEVDFWLPSPIGIGGGAIALLMAVSYGIKYRRVPFLRAVKILTKQQV